MLENFGVPASLMSVGAIVLAATEIFVALLLIPQSTYREGAIIALTLLTLFAIVISYKLSRGESPPCNCFGQVHSRPITKFTLLRIMLFAAAALFLIVAPELTDQPSLLAGIQQLSTYAWTSIGLGLGLLILAWLISHLMRQQGRLLLKLDRLEMALAQSGIDGQLSSDLRDSINGLEVGTRAPLFELPTLSGQVKTLSEFQQRHLPIVLIFTDPHCGPCSKLIPSIKIWQDEHHELFSIVLISRGTKEDNLGKFKQLKTESLLIQESSEIARAYKSEATPCAILIDEQGNISAPTSVGTEAIERLIKAEANRKAEVGILSPG